ncbi:hypothetical protein ZWY2020_020626 [Hordeum vulgare]|nr:hypothetical protein ZWY2020_020626 [Hordeum vulgare]
MLFLLSPVCSSSYSSPPALPLPSSHVAAPPAPRSIRRQARIHLHPRSPWRTPPTSSRRRRRGEVDEERWPRLLPELLTDIIRRIKAGAEGRLTRCHRSLFAVIGRAAVSIVRPLLECCRITFPSSLKQVRPDPGLSLPSCC